MKNEHVVVLTRQQLYDEVWKQSVAGVAKKYNLHYAKLINSLKQANIPYPSSGYWTRLGLGKDVTGDVVLLSGSAVEEVQLIPADAVIRRKRKESPDQPEKVEAAKEEQTQVEEVDVMPEAVLIEIPDTVLAFLPEAERSQVVEVITHLEIKQNAQLHKHLVTYKKAIKEYGDYLKQNRFPISRRNYYDHGKTIEPPQFVNDVSEDGINRVIQILDVLFKAVEKLGGMVQQDLSMQIRQDVVRVKFLETQDKIPHEITKQEAKELLEYKEAKRFGRYASEPRIKKYDNVYNGKLRIVFDDSSYIRDGAEAKIDDRLEDILIRLYELSETHRVAREKREEQHRIYLEEKQREENQKKRKQLEMEKIQALENVARDYQVACEIRNYISAVINKNDLTESDLEWIEWATKKADWYDPIIAREDEYLGKREHSRSADEKDLIKNKRNMHSW